MRILLPLLNKFEKPQNYHPYKQNQLPFGSFQVAMLIHVKTLENGKHVSERVSQSKSIEIDEGGTMAELQLKIAQVTGMSSRCQRILRGTIQLCSADSHGTDARTMADYGINHGDTLYCITRLRG